MKKITFVSAFLLLISLSSYGQRQAITQYFLNLPAVNPAFTGMEPFLDMKAAFRQRWNDFDNKNNSFYLSANGSLGQTSPTSYRKNSLRISNPAAYDRMATNRRVRRFHGLGGIITNQRTGPFQTLSLNASYAYHMPITRQLSMSLGTKAGFVDNQIDFTDFVVRDQVNDLFYQQLMNSAEGRQQQFVGDFGINFYTRNSFLGIASNHLIATSLSDDQLLNLDPGLSLDLMAGTQLRIHPQMELYPGTRLRHDELYGFTWEANLRVRYNQLIYFGVAYENEVKAALLFGLNLDSRYSINYSYDYYLNDLREFTTGNHEFTVGIALFNKYSIEPRLW